MGLRSFILRNLIEGLIDGFARFDWRLHVLNVFDPFQSREKLISDGCLQAPRAQDYRRSSPAAEEPFKSIFLGERSCIGSGIAQPSILCFF